MLNQLKEVAKSQCKLPMVAHSLKSIIIWAGQRPQWVQILCTGKVTWMEGLIFGLNGQNLNGFWLILSNLVGDGCVIWWVFGGH